METVCERKMYTFTTYNEGKPPIPQDGLKGGKGWMGRGMRGRKGGR